MITSKSGSKAWAIRLRSVVVGLLILAATGLTTLLLWRAVRRHRLEQRGERLFLGNEPLVGEIAEQEVPLPAHATRCNNCHGAVIGRGSSELVAPELNRAALLSETSRRSGPRVRYGRRSFCNLLRNGVDPASIGISRIMPRYRADDLQCQALFAYLTRK